MKLIAKKSIKNLVLSIFLIALGFHAFPQGSLPTKSDYQKFYKTKTLIVLENSPFSEYNDKIKEAIKQNWVLNGYDFISNEEFDQKKMNPNYSFLVTSIVTFNKDKTKAQYNFLSLLLGGKATDITNMKDLCSVPLSYLNMNEENYLYKLGALIRFIQNHISLVTKNPSIISDNVLKYYNKNTVQIKNKTLYITQEDLPPNTKSISKIKKLYPGRVKIVTTQEIEKAINNKNKDVVFLHKVGPEQKVHKARCFKIIIGADDAKIYYFDYHMIKNKETDSFLVRDFKRLLN